ncbi:MAG: serine--tRNA ligase [Acidobacteriota bacterium]
MIDRHTIREHFEQVREKLQHRRSRLDLAQWKQLDEEEKVLRQRVEELKALRNRRSEEIARLKKSGQDASDAIAEMKSVSDDIQQSDARVGELEARLQEWMSMIPNLPHDSVPVGHSEEENLVVRVSGEPTRFDFQPLDHIELGTRLGILDQDRSVRLAGARFSTLVGAGARLEMALIQFMLDVQTREHGYTEMAPPLMANSKTLFGTGQLPRFKEDLFKIENTDYYLIPTAEVPLTNFYAGEILEAEALPIKFTAYTPCFRSEAGSYGKDVRGLIRLHQFNKVELVKICAPENSYEELESLTRNAEEILRRLGLPYRVVALCTGDLGFASAKTYDLEVWLPAQDRYREISSCSNCEDFQARRAQIRYRPEPKAKPRLVHTLNGSGLAVGRTWLAILENFQQRDGSVIIPEVLRPYMGMEIIAAR